MRQLNKQAWDLLLPDEKMALSLQHGMQKSSWQAGEMMDKSHYKYLEIKYRGEAFLRMFTEHFKVFDSIIPPNVRGEEEVISYLELCISQRLKLTEVAKILNEKYGFSSIKAREQMVLVQMRKWEKSQDPYSHILYNLAKEFDRWNNFRILPSEIQEPSAFKRRNKKVMLKHIKTTVMVPDLAIPKIRKVLGARRGTDKVFLPIRTEHGKSYILEIRNTQPAIDNATNLNLYIFKDKRDARDYLTLLEGYMEPKKKSCNDGLQFWPKYREVIKLSVNYDPIQKIVPSRKYLQMALSKLELF